MAEEGGRTLAINFDKGEEVAAGPIETAQDHNMQAGAATYLFERGLTMGLSKRKILAFGGALILAAFLLGYVPVSLKNQSLNHQLRQNEQALAEQSSDFQKQQAALQEKLRLADLNNQLGMLMILTKEKNFGEARERSTRFFDGLRQFTQDTQDNSMREKLMAILNRRDEITADLTTANIGVTEKLRAFYQEMYELGVAQE